MKNPKVYLLEIFSTKLVYNLKAEASKTYLSYIWWVLEPALFVAVLYAVFGVFLPRGAENFVAFLVCGKIPFLWFSKSVVNSSSSIIAGRGLITQIALPKPFFPLLVVAQDLVKQAFVFFLMFMFLVFYGIEPSFQWFLVIFVILTQLVLIISVSLFVASVTPFLPDFKYIVSTGMMLLMFGSGIFYSYEDVILPGHQKLFLMNPIANLIKNYRQVLLDSTQPDWVALLYINIASILLIVLMLSFFRRADAIYARLVST